MPEDRRNRNQQIKEALDPLDLRPRIDRYAREGLAFGHRVRERVPASDTGAVVRGLVAGYLAGWEAGESLQGWLRRQPPETLAAMSRPGASDAWGTEDPGGVPRLVGGPPQRGAPVDRAGVAGGA